MANTDKVSLDPYRLESRKILSVVKESLPAALQKVEKASIDEVVSYTLGYSWFVVLRVHRIDYFLVPGLVSPSPFHSFGAILGAQQPSPLR